MPFQSEKQRRYMHANLPEIAKRWERDYANGGIARVGLANGNFLDKWKQHATASEHMDLTGVGSHQKKGYNFAQNFPSLVPGSPITATSWVGPGLAKAYQYAQELGRAALPEGILGGTDISFADAWNKAGVESDANIQGMVGKGFDKDKYDEWMEAGGYYNPAKNIFSTSAQASIPEDKIKAMRQDLKSVPDHMRRQTVFPTYKRTAQQYYPPSQDLEAQNIRPTFDSSDEEQDYYNQISNKIGKMPTIKDPNMFQRFRNKFYKPATRNVGGYNVAQLNKMNALGGYYSEPAREARRFDKRGINVLNRAAAGKKVGNVNKLLGQYGYEGGAPGSGDISFTGKPQGDPTAGAGYSRRDDSWGASPFRGGGLASLWPR